MEYKLKLDDFEGPLDLLLHLIKEAELDIFNIKIEVIVSQYLDFIHEMEKLNLNIASEYLVMASELIELKSKLLLPSNRIEDEEDEEINPEEDLINKLIEYQRYKDKTVEFRKLEEDRKELFTKLPTNFDEYLEDERKVNNSDVTLDDLLNAFQKFIDRKNLEKPLNTKITKKEISVEERSISIRKILRDKKRVSFFDLFDILTKEYIVATFLAILEMARKHELRITQEKRFDDIICEVQDE